MSKKEIKELIKYIEQLGPPGFVLRACHQPSTRTIVIGFHRNSWLPKTKVVAECFYFTEDMILGFRNHHEFGLFLRDKFRAYMDRYPETARKMAEMN